MSYNNEVKHIKFKSESGKQMHAVEMGSGKFLVFLLHGWSNNWEIWREIASYDENCQFTFVAMDVPGFGDSERLDRYNLDITSKLIVEFISNYLVENHDSEFEGIFVGGLSMGSLLASYVASMGVPNISGYVLMGPIFAGHGKPIGKFVLKNILYTARGNIFAKKILDITVRSRVVSYLAGKYLNTYKFNWSSYRQNLGGKSLMDINAYIDIGIDQLGYNTLGALQKARKESAILLLMGKYDKMVDAEKISAGEIFSLDLHDNLSVQLIDEAGHIVSYEKPKETYECLLQFAEKCKLGC